MDLLPSQPAHWDVLGTLPAPVGTAGGSVHLHFGDWLESVTSKEVAHTPLLLKGHSQRAAHLSSSRHNKLISLHLGMSAFLQGLAMGGRVSSFSGDV